MRQSYYKIDPMYEKKEFLRKAWISLAHEDVPLEVFESDFGDVAQEEYHILCTGADYEVSWSGEIGNDRIETYLDVETYYDQEPYTDYERKYNASTKNYDTVPVTKYRRVEKQRQVQKRRTVTDWHSGSGEHAGSAKSWDCVDPRGTFDDKRYSEDVKSDYFVDFDEDELAQAPDMYPTDAMLSRADNLRDEHLRRNLHISLPGDHSRGITYRTLAYDHTYTTMFRVPEYVATIHYNGNAYTKRAFACGNMTMSKARIPNPISAESEKKRLNIQRNKEIETAKEKLEKKAWGKEKRASHLAIIALLASIATSLLIKDIYLVVGCFIAAIVLFINAKTTRKNAEAAAGEKLNKLAEETDATYSDKIQNYQNHRKADLLSALNKKLSALGLEPATEAEFKKT